MTASPTPTFPAPAPPPVPRGGPEVSGAGGEPSTPDAPLGLFLKIADSDLRKIRTRLQGNTSAFMAWAALVQEARNKESLDGIYLSDEILGDRIGVHRNTAHAARASLASIDLIEVYSKRDRKTGKLTPSKYRLFPALCPLAKPCDGAKPCPCTKKKHGPCTKKKHGPCTRVVQTKRVDIFKGSKPPLKKGEYEKEPAPGTPPSGGGLEGPPDGVPAGAEERGDQGIDGQRNIYGTPWWCLVKPDRGGPRAGGSGRLILRFFLPIKAGRMLAMRRSNPCRAKTLTGL